MLVSMTMLSFRMRLLPQAAILQCANFMVVHTVSWMTQLLPFVITSPLHNKQWCKYRRLLTIISQFEDVLDLKYMVICLHTQWWSDNYIHIPWTYTLNMHIYITLNTDWIHQHTIVDVYVDIRISQHFCKVPRMSR